MNVIHIDCFTTLDELKGKALTYENFKALALKAGRFSVFDASDMKRARLLDRLCQDPEIETDHSCGFPWTLVRLRQPEPPERQDDGHARGEGR